MPNIELHGYPRGEAMALKDKIFELFQDKSYVDEMVVTLCSTTVWNKKGEMQPFVRLANSCQEHAEEILEGLQALEVDIEHLVLAKFIPKKKG